MRFIILGLGAVGGVVAARLWQADHEVIAIARGAHLDVLRRDGLTLQTPEGKDTLPIPAVPSASVVDFGDGDVVLLTVKSQDTFLALRSLASCASHDLPVVCLQNGVANERTALRWFANVYGAVVMVPATFLQPGVVAAHSTPLSGILDVGCWPAGADELTAAVTRSLEAAGFSSRPRPDISRWKYGKLLDNLSNVVDALCGPAARRGPLFGLLHEEGRRCLEAAGIPYVTRDEDRTRRGDLLNFADAVEQSRLGSSSWQSLARGLGSTETDYLNGEIVLLGRLHGVPTPANELLQRLAREHAQNHGSPAAFDPDNLVRQVHLTRVELQ